MIQNHDNGTAREQRQELPGKLGNYKRSFTLRVIGGIALAVVVLWGFWPTIGPIWPHPLAMPGTTLMS